MSNFGIREPLSEISFGDFPGYETRTIQITASAITTTEQTAWEAGGNYVFPAAAGTLTLVSTSAQDGPAGTGLSTVLVQGLDANWDDLSEVVVMNGLTGVVTTNSFFRVNRMVGIAIGSGAVYGAANAGTITATHGVAGILDQIQPGRSLSSTGVFSCPAGKKCKFENSSTAIETNKAVITGINTITGTTGVRIVPSELLVSEQLSSDKRLAATFPEKTDIEIRVAMTTGSGDYRSSIILQLKDL
jgi:hypothetical protein